MTSNEQHAAIRTFVVHTLGCTCPDKVFENIETESAYAATPTINVDRLVIGDRLLLYLVRQSQLDIPHDDILSLVSAGRNDRDSNGYNRFRLVVVTLDATIDTAAISADFAAACDVDDKVHLHFIPAEHVTVLS